MAGVITNHCFIFVTKVAEINQSSSSVLNVLNVTFSGKWSTLEDVNVKNQVHLHLIFDVKVFQHILFPRERHLREVLQEVLRTFFLWSATYFLVHELI